MTDPAKLYLKDLDILEEARSQLVEFLDTVKKCFDDDIKERWRQDGGEQNLSGWKAKGGGQWNVYIDWKDAALRVVISDPRQARQDPSTFDVVAFTAKKNVDQIRRSESLQASLAALAEEESLSWDWANHDRLCILHVPLIPESAEDTASQLIEEAMRFLRLGVRFDSLLAEGER